MLTQDIVPQTSNFTQLDWYKPLITEISDAIKMAVIESRIRLVEGHWSVGKLIRTASEGIDVTELVQAIAVDLRKLNQNTPNSVGISERTLWYCLKAYDLYPEIDRLPDGNNISWNKLIKNYLTSPGDKIEEEHLLECPMCHFKGGLPDFNPK